MLKFAPFVSDVELGFFSALAARKIDLDRLNETPIPLVGHYDVKQHNMANFPCQIQITGSSFQSSETEIGPSLVAPGDVHNFNTIETYQNVNKAEFLHKSGLKIWHAIHDGSILNNPSRLAAFSMMVYADLKKYKFTYLLAFPALYTEASWRYLSHEDHLQSSKPMCHSKSESLDSLNSTALTEAVHQWFANVDVSQRGFFLVKKLRERNALDPEHLGNDKASFQDVYQVNCLQSYETGFFENVCDENRYFAFIDPSNHESFPGWMLRNLLYLMQVRWNIIDAKILRFRDMQRLSSRISCNLVMRIRLSHSSRNDAKGDYESRMGSPLCRPLVSGWERNMSGKVVHRQIDLGKVMDPLKLADQAVDLNLKLMKWRILPTLNLDIIKQTKCLLLGAGTLGSYVSRNLMAWGVQKITFVDNGRVSFSNPVRQPLYTHEDCLLGGKPKAVCAANALKSIYPGIDSSGHVLAVPMIGHSILDEIILKAEFEALSRLIEAHDVVYLLMDSRESRWLPTVICQAMGKTVLNVALGFDTFLVMRHGIRNLANESALGCYFCNDVVAPSDSFKDRTLDQQCTVTRPGVAAMASAISVELLVSLLQSRAEHAKMIEMQSAAKDQCSLGQVPHQIRGFLADFRQLCIEGCAYKCCSACSPEIVKAYKADGWNFVLKALSQKEYITELSGLAQVQRAAEIAMNDIESGEDFDDVCDV